MDKHPYHDIFKTLGARYRRLRIKRGMVQEDAIYHGFSVRHYQQLEAGRPHSLTTLFRLSIMFQTDPASLLSGLPRLPRPKESPDGFRRESRNRRKDRPPSTLRH